MLPRPRRPPTVPDPALGLTLVGVCAAFALLFGRGRAGSRWLAGRRALSACAAFGAAVAVGRFALVVAGWLAPDSPVNTDDFAVFYGAARAVREGAPLYDLAGIRQDAGEVAVYRHAPIGATVLVPLTWLSPRAALDAWRLLNVGVYVATLGVLLRHFRLDPRGPLALGLIALWFVSAPSRESLAGGQWDALFLAAGTAALLLLARRRDAWAGAVLALPIALKFYPALLLLMPLVTRRYRALTGCALAGAALTLLGLLVAGPANTRAFFTEVLPAVGGGTLYAENQSLYALIGRLLAADLAGNGLGARYPAGPTAWLARGLGLVVTAVSALAARQRAGGPLDPALRFVLPVPATLLVIPTAWVHYELWALLPLAVLGVALARERPPWPVALCFVVAALLLPFGTEREVVHPGPYGLVGRLLLSYKVYGLLALWLGLVLATWRGGMLRSATPPLPRLARSRRDKRP